MLAKNNKLYVPTYRDDFFNDLVSSRYYGRNYASVPAVNISDDSDEFRIDVMAAGLPKDAINITIENDVLTISSENKEEKKESKENFTRREFNFTSFRRSFQLPDSVDQDNIKARQADGILSVHLPKKEESVKPGPKSIQIG